MIKNDWNNKVMDTRLRMAKASLRKADDQAEASHAPSAGMRPVVDAASGPAESAPAPLVPSGDRGKVQP